MEKITPRHTITKLSKPVIKRKILMPPEGGRGTQIRTKIRMTSDCLLKMMQRLKKPVNSEFYTHQK